MEALQSFALENWLWLVIAAIGLIIVINVVKTVIKWAIVIIVVGGILIYGFNYDVGTLKNLSENAVNYTKEQAMKSLLNEAVNATYEVDGNGNYTVKTKSATLRGKVGAEQAELEIMGQKFTINVDQALKVFIDQIKEKKQYDSS